MTSEMGKNMGVGHSLHGSEFDSPIQGRRKSLDETSDSGSGEDESNRRSTYLNAVSVKSSASPGKDTQNHKLSRDEVLAELVVNICSGLEKKIASDFNKIDERLRKSEVSVPSRDEKVTQLKIEIAELIKEDNRHKQNETSSKPSSVSSPMYVVQLNDSAEAIKNQLKTKVKEYMHLLSDMGGHSLEVPNGPGVSHILQLDKALNKMKAALNSINTSQRDSDSEPRYAFFHPNIKMKPFNSVERLLTTTLRLKDVTKVWTDDLQQMVQIISDITDAYYAIAHHEVDDDNTDDLIQEQIRQVIVGEFDKPGMMDDIIGKESRLLGYEWHELKMLGTILKIAGYVLLGLVALATVLTIVDATFPALLLSLAVTAQANFIVSQAINAVTTLGAMLGVNLSVGAAAASSTAVFASAVTMFGKAVQVCAGPSQLMLDKNQAASDIADAARALATF